MGMPFLGMSPSDGLKIGAHQAGVHRRIRPETHGSFASRQSKQYRNDYKPSQLLPKGWKDLHDLFHATCRGSSWLFAHL